MSDIAIRVENLSKQYRIGGPLAGLRTGPQAGYKTIRESLVEAVKTPFCRPWLVVRRLQRDHLGAEGHLLRGEAGRGGGHHQATWGRQEHSIADLSWHIDPHHQGGADQRPGGRPPGTGQRL